MREREGERERKVGVRGYEELVQMTLAVSNTSKLIVCANENAQFQIIGNRRIEVADTDRIKCHKHE